jgi:hypothetical protein
MNSETPPPRASLRAGYEVRDVVVPLVVGAAIVLVLAGIGLHLMLWEVSVHLVPEQTAPGALPPTVMPGEAPVNDRVRAVPPPRLDPLEPVESEPPYRSSRPLPDRASPTQRPEDLRADRQPHLHEYGWVEKGKVARIPIGVAMDAVVEMEKAKAPKKGSGK